MDYRYHLRAAAKDLLFRRTKKVQIFGERCSGTNFLRALLLQNLDVLVTDDFGWKHGYLSGVAVPDDTTVVVITREVFSWLKSVFGKPWHTTKNMRECSFSEFIRTPWTSYIDDQFHFPKSDRRNGAVVQVDRHPITGKVFANCLEMRTTKLAAWRGLENRCINVQLCTLDETTADPEALIRSLSEKFGLRRKTREIHVPQGHFGWQWTSRPVPKNFEIGDADRRFILDNLDLELEKSFGFDYGASSSGTRSRVAPAASEISPG